MAIDHLTYDANEIEEIQLQISGERISFAAYRHTPFWDRVEDAFIGSREVNCREMRKSVDFNVELPIRVSDDDAFLLTRSGDFKNVSCPCENAWRLTDKWSS